MARPTYVPTVAEAVTTRPRTRLFAAAEAMLGLTELGAGRDRTIAGISVIETVISREPPWRLVLDTARPDGRFHQESFVAVPHDDATLVMWSALVSEPTDDDRAYADAVADAVAGRLAAITDAP